LITLLFQTPEELRAAVAKALGRRDHPLRSWVSHLSDRQSRLSSDLPEEVLRRLLEIYLGEPDNLDSFSLTCDQCGLERPMHKGLRDVFAACPACGSGAWTWTHLVEAPIQSRREVAPSRQARIEERSE
jgi:hypothetical protein